MKKQDYSNHVRYYTPHHFIFYPIILALLVFVAVRLANSPGDKVEWLVLGSVIFLTGWLSYMMRQHYALTLQNRIVVLEMRLRYYQLTGERFENIAAELTFAQVAALRFASDKELPGLTERTVRENLSPKAIKTSIQHWVPDTMRV